MRSGWSFVIKLSLTGAILALVAVSVDFQAMGPALARADWALLCVVFAIGVAQTAVLALRWRIVAIFVGVDLPASAAAQGTLVSIFFSQGLPASIGGDVFRIWWMTRRTGASTGVGSHVVLMDRISGFLALLGLSLLSIAILGSQLSGPAGDAMLIAFAACMLGIVIVLLPQPRLVRRWLARLTVATPARLRALLYWLVELRRLFVQLLRNPRALALNFGLGEIVHCVSVLMVYLVILAFDYQLTIAQCLAVVPLVLLVAYLPLSIAGWGTREASMIFGLGLFGVPDSGAFLVSVTIGIVVLAISLIGGALWVGTAMRSAFLRSQMVDANQ